MKKKKKNNKKEINSLHKTKKKNKKENIAKKEEIQNEKLGKGFHFYSKTFLECLH